MSSSNANIWTSQVTQRVYEWRGAFGSVALRAFEAFFNSDPAKYASVEARSEYCKDIVLRRRVCYANPGGSDKVVRAVRSLHHTR